MVRRNCKVSSHWSACLGQVGQPKTQDSLSEVAKERCGRGKQVRKLAVVVVVVIVVHVAFVVVGLQ